MKKIKKATKRLNLTFEDDYYDFLKTKADQNYIRLGTWVKQFLKQNLIKNNTANKIEQQ
jgi:hypothetical protein